MLRELTVEEMGAVSGGAEELSNREQCISDAIGITALGGGFIGALAGGGNPGAIALGVGVGALIGWGLGEVFCGDGAEEDSSVGSDGWGW